MIVSSNQFDEFVLSSSPIALLRDFFPSLPSFPYLTSKGCLYSWSCGSSSLHSILDPLTMSSKHTKGVPTPHVREYLKTSAAQELPKKFPPIQVLEICKTGQSRDAENPCNFSSKSHRQSWVNSVSWRMFKGKIEKVFQPATWCGRLGEPFWFSRRGTYWRPMRRPRVVVSAQLYSVPAEKLVGHGLSRIISLIMHVSLCVKMRGDHDDHA